MREIKSFNKRISGGSFHIGGRGKEKETFWCGFTTVILYVEERLAYQGSLSYYNDTLMDDLPRMQVEADVFRRKKQHIQDMFKR